MCGTDLRRSPLGPLNGPPNGTPGAPKRARFGITVYTVFGSGTAVTRRHGLNTILEDTIHDDTMHDDTMTR